MWSEGPKDVIISLAQIDFIDSSGLGALVKLVKKAKTAGGSLQIVTNPRVTQTVKLVRLEKFFSLQPTLEEAIETSRKSVNRGISSRKTSLTGQWQGFTNPRGS
jgi:anti-anti-sigma regulatory factor